MSKDEKNNLLELERKKQKYTDEKETGKPKKQLSSSTFNDSWIESNIKEYRKMLNGDDGGDGGSEDEYNLTPCQCYGEIEFEDKQTPSSVS